MTSLKKIIEMVESECRSKVLTESISYEYKVPKDPEIRFYDFYILSLYDSLLKHKDTLRNGLLKPGWDEDTVADLVSIVHNGFEELLNYMYKDVLDAASYAVMSELRHTLDNGNEDYIFKALKPTGLSGKFKLFDDHYSKSPTATDVDGVETKTSDHAVEAFQKVKMSVDDIIKIGKVVFDLDIWEKKFGGSNWTNITKGLERLKNAKSLNEKTVAIDHIFDLEHNTGSLFTKINRYKKPIPGIYNPDGDWYWIDHALDFKYRASPLELAAKGSIPMSVIGRLNRLTGADKNVDQTGGNLRKVMKDGFTKEVLDKLGISLDSESIEEKKDFSIFIDQNGRSLFVSSTYPFDHVLQKILPPYKIVSTGREKCVKVLSQLLKEKKIAIVECRQGAHFAILVPSDAPTEAQKEKICAVFLKVCNARNLNKTKDPYSRATYEIKIIDDTRGSWHKLTSRTMCNVDNLEFDLSNL